MLSVTFWLLLPSFPPPTNNAGSQRGRCSTNLSRNLEALWSWTSGSTLRWHCFFSQQICTTLSLLTSLNKVNHVSTSNCCSLYSSGALIVCWEQTWAQTSQYTGAWGHGLGSGPASHQWNCFILNPTWMVRCLILKQLDWFIHPLPLKPHWWIHCKIWAKIYRHSNNLLYWNIQKKKM